jgi:hypothetical protein
MEANNGKPSGSVAETRRQPGIKTETRAKSATPGAGEGGSEKQSKAGEVHPAGEGGPKQNAGGPRHHGGDAHMDNNP